MSTAVDQMHPHGNLGHHSFRLVSGVPPHCGCPIEQYLVQNKIVLCYSQVDWITKVTVQRSAKRPSSLASALQLDMKLCDQERAHEDDIPSLTVDNRSFRPVPAKEVLTSLSVRVTSSDAE